MRHAIKTANGNYQSSARVVDGKLILSFPHALTPIVWQMDLTEAKSSALEVNEDKGRFVLVLKTVRGEKTDVAPFEKREDAIDALMAASRALENAHGQIRHSHDGGETASVTRIAGQPKQRGRWLSMGLCAFLLLVLLITWSALAPRAPRDETSSPVAASSTDPNAPAPADANGAPINADELLMKNR